MSPAPRDSTAKPWAQVGSLGLSTRPPQGAGPQGQVPVAGASSSHGPLEDQDPPPLLERREGLVKGGAVGSLRETLVSSLYVRF